MKGFLESALVGLLISLSFSYFIVTMEVLNQSTFITGEQLLHQFVISAIFGAVVGISTLIFYIERFPYLTRIAMHFIFVIISSGIAGYFGEWFEYGNIRSMFNTFITVLLIYVVIWYFFYSKAKREIREMNELLEKRQEM
jgi:hypothetical protein